MKAAQIKAYGDVDVITVNEEAAMPIAGEGQVIVEVHASSLNPIETMLRLGYVQEMFPLQLPATLGGDVAGVIHEVGQGVTEFNVGDKVYGQASVLGGASGAFAEYAATATKQLALMPSNLSFNEAAAVPLTGVSALQALQDHIKLQPDQKILIHGGSGGIGTVAIQLAKHIGAFVATTVPGDAAEYVKDMGADVVIDYKTQNFEDLIHDYDAVFDCVGGDIFEKSFSVLREGGVAVSMIAKADEAAAKEHGITAITQSTHVTTSALDTLRTLIEAGDIKIHVDSVFSLSDIQAAFKKREGSSVRGKVVIEIKNA